MNAFHGIEPAPAGTIARDLGARENIVLNSRASILLQVVGEDPAYVVGYYVDLRGLRVSTTLVRVAKDEIALRIEQESTPHPDELRFKGNG